MARKTTTDFHRALTDLIRVYQFRDRNRICAHGITVSESHALDRLVQLGPMTLNDLADDLRLDKSTVSRVLDGLERKGHISRGTHPEDGRALLLKATPKGRRLLGRLERERVEVEGDLLKDFTPAMLRAATLAITRIVAEAEPGRAPRDR